MCGSHILYLQSGQRVLRGVCIGAGVSEIHISEETMMLQSEDQLEARRKGSNLGEIRKKGKERGRKWKENPSERETKEQRGERE